MINSFLSRLAVVTGERSTRKWERCGSDYLAAVQVIHSVELSSQEGPYIRSMSVLVKQSSIAICSTFHKKCLLTTIEGKGKDIGIC